jgi:hypothetical protein
VKILPILLGVMLLLNQIDFAFARTYYSKSKSYSSRSKKTKSYSPHKSKAVSGVKRDKRGRIKRSSSSKNAFKKSHPCPSTGKSKGACHGYVIDHRTPLKKGGSDSPSNMQWQTKEAAKAKDKWE